jgi:hypothetical protein
MSDHIIDELKFRLLYEGLFEDFIDRSNAEIPDTFVPSAKGIAVFHDMLLYLANPLAMYGTHRPYRWVNVVSQGKFMMGADPYILSVCRSVSHGPFCWIGCIGQGDQRLHCG